MPTPRSGPTPASLSRLRSVGGLAALGADRSRWHLLGRDGVRAAVYQDFYEGDKCVRREAVSDDTYRPISRAEWTMP